MEVDHRRPFDSLEEQPTTHHPPPKRPRRQARPKEPPPPLHKASVSELAEGGAASANSSTAGIDDAVISRIKKCLDRANHQNTTEAEAKAAFHLASRLMGQFNVSQAEVLAHVTPETRRQYAGQSTIDIKRLDGNDDKQVPQQGHVANLGHAMGTFFDCKFFTRKNYSSFDVVYYGIAENTVAAAMAFERAYNMIADWARHYKGVGSKNSYCHGVADELLKSARGEKAREEEKARRAEAEAVAATAQREDAERAAELARLIPPTSPGESTTVTTRDSLGRDDLDSSDSGSGTAHLSDDDDEYGDVHDGHDGTLDEDDYVKPDFDFDEEKPLDITMDVDREIESILIKQESQGLKASSSPEPPSHDLHSIPLAPQQVKKEEDKEGKPSEPDLGSGVLEWTSHGQLVTFRATAAETADDYLKECRIRLRQGPKRKWVLRDEGAYRQGKKDSKNIDVHRKMISE